MTSPRIRILHLEDEARDAELAAAAIVSDGIEADILHVDTRQEFDEALRTREFDLILADYNLPSFDGASAQRLAAQLKPDLPFILLSGTIGEERAVELLKAGATDYVLKERMGRLGGSIRRALSEARERTERRRAEIEVRRLNAQLEARVHDATRSLEQLLAETNAARQEADRANNAKSEFLSRMSHELRTPLNAVIGFAQLLSVEPLTPDQSESVEMILRGGRHLLSLIDEVLDIARIEAGQLSLSPEPVDVRELVHHTLQLAAPLAAPREIGLTIVAEPADRCAVIADRQRLHQLLLNLVSNAVKYNRRGGRVEVEIREGADGRVRISVSDTGAGIPADKMSRLFTPFERLGAETTSIEGTGLGLAVSRALAHAMGGSMGVASEVGRGTTFWVELALADGAALHAADDQLTVPAATAHNAGGVVLYVEDNAQNVRLMERIVARLEGVILRHAPDGRSAMVMAEEICPDLILLDLHLPDVSGPDVLDYLTRHPELHDIPVVVLTADAAADRRHRMIAAGASGYLTKPLDVPDVLSTIDSLLAARRGRP